MQVIFYQSLGSVSVWYAPFFYMLGKYVYQKSGLINSGLPWYMILIWIISPPRNESTIDLSLHDFVVHLLITLFTNKIKCVFTHTPHSPQSLSQYIHCLLDKVKACVIKYIRLSFEGFVPKPKSFLLEWWLCYSYQVTGSR